MEELFNNILVLVPVALLIFLRVFAEGARKRTEKARMEAAAAPPEQARATQASRALGAPSGTRGEAAQASRKELRQASRKQRQEKQEKTKPSTPARRDLLGRLRNYLSGSLDQLMDQTEPLHFEEEAQRKLGQFRTPGGSSVPPKSGTAPASRQVFTGALEETPAVVHEPLARYVIPKQLESMPPLKRAIVLSEILGKPKSLQ